VKYIFETFYTLDAQGNSMAIYTLKTEDSQKNLYLSERNIYGSSRLGMENVNYLIASSNTGNIEAYAPENIVVGDKAFELSNHLGNFNDTWVLSNKTLSGINPVRNLSEATGVLNTITDKKLPEFDATTGDLAFFNAVVVGYSDYYPFGMQMPGRHGSDNADSYRYGFNGMESDDEVKGVKNSYTTEFRQYDPRVSRWLSLDPLFANFPWQSPYVAFDNNPIINRDPKGLAANDGPSQKYQKYIKKAVESMASNVVFKGPYDGERKYNNDFFEVTIESDGAQILVVKDDISAFDAINDIVNNPQYYGLDCGEFVQVARLYAEANTMKKKDFDKQFKEKNLKVPAGFDNMDDVGITTHVFYARSAEMDSEGNVQVGAWHTNKKPTPNLNLNSLISNLPIGTRFTLTNVSPAAKGTSFQNENIVKVGDNQFIAHGLFDDNEPRSLGVIRQALLTADNTSLEDIQLIQIEVTTDR
jgi:RHS repeat-associated protein